MVKGIALSQGLFARVDDEDYERVWRFNWSAYHTNGHTYACRKVPVANGSSTTVGLHRFIMDAPANRDVIFRDGDGLNCTKANMLLATRAQNCRRRRKQQMPTSQYTGVYWSTERHKWRAWDRINGKIRHLGYFTDEIEAARARAEHRRGLPC